MPFLHEKLKLAVRIVQSSLSAAASVETKLFSIVLLLFCEKMLSLAAS